LLAHVKVINDVLLSSSFHNNGQIKWGQGTYQFILFPFSFLYSNLRVKGTFLTIGVVKMRLSKWGYWKQKKR
jgi:hypothetical protein